MISIHIKIEKPRVMDCASGYISQSRQKGKSVVKGFIVPTTVQSKGVKLK